MSLTDPHFVLSVTVLDKHGPKNWHRFIDIKKLALKSGRDCVLGQLYGSFDRGCKRLDLNSCEVIGFTGYQTEWYEIISRRKLADVRPRGWFKRRVG